MVADARAGPGRPRAAPAGARAHGRRRDPRDRGIAGRAQLSPAARGLRAVGDSAVAMASLRAELGVRLDASSLVQTFLANVQGPAAALQGIADPTPADAVAGIDADLGGVD